MIPDEHLKYIISKYWDPEKNEVADHDFTQEALLAQLILDVRSSKPAHPLRKFWWGPN
jgi:hypothetical protein